MADGEAGASSTMKQSAVGALTDDQKVTVLLATYEKHAKALLAVEDSQQKLVAVLLAIFSAGIALLDRMQLEPPTQVAFIGVTVLLTAFGALLTYRRSKARQSIRRAVVDIEVALHFYEDGVYLKGQPLYPRRFLEFPEKRWLAWIYFVVVLAALVFVILVLTRGK